METSTKGISTLALRRLLHDLRDKGGHVCIRYRLLGELWKTNFTRPVKITEHGAILSDDITLELVFLANLDDVAQFELDGRFQEFQPHYHYTVMPE